ncbi:MAG TPA: disulfide bond formation protein DsbC [Acidobacteriaceae bacterium]
MPASRTATVRKSCRVAQSASMLLLTALAACSTGAQQLPQGLKDPQLPIHGAQNRPGSASKDPVQFLYPSEVTVTAHRPAAIDLKFHVADGLHINSHTPHEKTLIPTRLAVVEEPGVNVSGIDFPPGVDYALAFSPKEKLSVYTGDFTLRAHVSVPPGPHSLDGVLRYQACDVNSCMPPRNLQFSVSIVAK